MSVGCTVVPRERYPEHRIAFPMEMVAERAEMPGVARRAVDQEAGVGSIRSGKVVSPVGRLGPLGRDDRKRR
jgi:hypothetical protein